MGCPERLLRPLRSMYTRLRRRFCFAGGIGEEWIASNGILQGCPLSVILLNALVSVWAKAVEQEVSTAQCEAYADDTQALTRTRRDVTLTAAITDEFANLSGQSLSHEKSYCFTTAAGDRKRVNLANQKIAWRKQAKVLGAQLVFQGAADTSLVEANFNTASEFAKRAGWFPLGFDDRVRLVAAGGLPGA
eukprot:11825339-Karenia_brevis.AAC.1